MPIRRTVSVAVSLGAAFLLVLSGCSDDASAGSADPTGQATEGTTGESDAPAETTIDLTVGGDTVDLGDATLTCYDYQGHLMVEAHNPDNPDASHFLMDYYQDTVSLSIGVQKGQPDLFQYEQGANGQRAEVTRDGNSVTVDGTIGVAFDSSAEPRPFTIAAQCAEFVNTPPDSSKVDGSGLPDVPSSCPPGEVVCIPDGN